jgi:predicted ATPase
MSIKADFTNIKTSWTKYDIVQVLEVVESLSILNKFKTGEAKINEPILKSFLGIDSLNDPLPEYWIEIQNYPNEKKIFALFATLFTHGEIVKEFALKYSTGDMKGVFKVEDGKQYTNIRSALIESGVSAPVYRRTPEVPFDFSPIFQNPAIGKLFKKVLIERISRIANDFNDDEFYTICYDNKFHQALSLSKHAFKAWLEGIAPKNNITESSYLKQVEISNFFSIENINLDFENAKEIYFLGENGDGKSLILMAIYLAFNGNYILEKTDQEETGKAADIIRNYRSIELSGVDSDNKEYGLKKNLYINNFFAYGTHRGRISSDEFEEYGFMSLFSSEKMLMNPVSWLNTQKLLELEKALDSRNAFPEIKKLPNSFQATLLETMFYDLLEKHVEIKIENADVKFKEKGMELSFDQLSEGYKSILIFISDLIYRFNKTADQGQEMKDFKGIVLVDEIDLHLHPKWQRVIIGKIRKLFPNLQFIFTTHSPTIIQGASEDSIIYRVYRNNKDGKTRVSDPYHRKLLNHLMINSILTSPLFGVNDSRMNPQDDNSDTSDSYLLYRINNIVEEKLEEQKKNGKEFIKDEEIDKLIREIINKELGDGTN